MLSFIVLFASPASLDGKNLGPEMKVRVEEVGRFLLSNSGADVIVASSASGFSPNELYFTLVRDSLIQMGVSEFRIKMGRPSASTVAEIDGAEYCISSTHYWHRPVGVAAGWYQVPRTRFIWWWRHRRVTFPVYITMKGVPKSYVILRCLMEPVKLLLYFVLSTKSQDDANHKVLGPRGL